MAAGIFISYRRDGTRHVAGRLSDDLAHHFGTESIFRDIEAIELGVDFAQSLETALDSCVIMLVLIGPGWLLHKDEAGNRRLDNPDDWVRLEIATALKRDVRVVPVLLEDAALPAAADLPEDLQPLVRRQALEMSDARWRGDLQRLVETLARLPGLNLKREAEPVPVAPAPTPAPPASKSSMKPMMIGIGLGVIGLLVVGGFLAEEEYVEPTGPVGDSIAHDVPLGDFGVPDMVGLWRTHTGETYHFEQDGDQVTFTAEAAGQPAGHGRGQFDGQMLRLAFTMMIQGQPAGSANCDLQPGPDHRSFSGSCMGPNGPFGAQIFR